MSNIKSVLIEGEIPFNATEHHDACKFLGQLNGPTIGLKIEYTGNAPGRPNSYGGKTSFYKFRISGEEAIADGWVKNLLQAFVNCGSAILKVELRDVENKSSAYSMKVPTPNSEFVCEVRFAVEREQSFEQHHLEEWLRDAVVLDLDTEEAGKPHGCNVTGASLVLKTLSPA